MAWPLQIIKIDLFFLKAMPQQLGFHSNLGYARGISDAKRSKTLHTIHAIQKHPRTWTHLTKIKHIKEMQKHALKPTKDTKTKKTSKTKKKNKSIQHVPKFKNQRTIKHPIKPEASNTLAINNMWKKKKHLHFINFQCFSFEIKIQTIRPVF